MSRCLLAWTAGLLVLGAGPRPGLAGPLKPAPLLVQPRPEPWWYFQLHLPVPDDLAEPPWPTRWAGEITRYQLAWSPVLYSTGATVEVFRAAGFERHPHGPLTFVGRSRGRPAGVFTLTYP